MREFIVRAIGDANLLEALSVLGFLIIGPPVLFMKGLRCLSSKKSYLRSPGKGTLYLAAAALSAATSAWFLLAFGGVFLRHIQHSFGPWVYGFFVTVIVCAIALPICYTGWQLRLAWEHQRQKDTQQLARTCLLKGYVGLGTTALVIAVIFFAASPTLAAGLAVLTAVSLPVGWFGSVLVPDL